MELRRNGRIYPPALLIKCFAVLFFVLMVVVWLCLVISNRASDELETGLQLLAAVAVLGVVLGACGLYRRAAHSRILGRLFEENPWQVAAIVMGLTLLLQVIMVVSIYTPIGWDVEWTLEAATATTTYQRVDYFTAYPNNLLLAFYERIWLAIFAFFGMTDAWLALCLVGVLSVDVAIMSIYAVAARAYGVKTAYATLFFSILLFGFTPWLIVPYSDIYSMPYVAGILCCYLGWRQSTATVRRVVYAALCGLLAGVGFLLKPHTIVMVVAIAIVHLFYLKKGEVRSTLVACAVVAAVALAAYGGFQLFVRHQTVVPIIDGRAFPVEHFINTGLSSDPDFGAHGAYGGYSQENVNAIQHLTSTAEMQAVSRAMIKQRLGEMGFGGYISFLFSKLRWVMSEGYFYWGLEGGFADFTQREPNFFTQLFYRNGDNFSLYLYSAQGVWIVVLLFVAIGAGCAVFKKTDRRTAILECAVFGLLCFLMLFEGRARYLISYLPCFSLLAAVGLGETYRGVRGLALKRRIDA